MTVWQISVIVLSLILLGGGIFLTWRLGFANIALILNAGRAIKDVVVGVIAAAASIKAERKYPLDPPAEPTNIRNFVTGQRNEPKP